MPKGGGCIRIYQENPNMLCNNQYIAHSVLAHLPSLNASD